MNKMSEKFIKMGTFVLNFFIKILIGFTLWIFLIIPIVFPLYGFFSLVRHLVHNLAKIYRPDLIPIENVADASMTFIPSDQCPSMNVAQVWKIKGTLSVKKFREHFHTTFLSSDELRKAYENFYCYFVEWVFYCFKKRVEKLSLENHIREFDLEDGVTFEEFVAKWMVDGTYGILNNNFEGNSNLCPCWEILIINSKDKDDLESEVSFLLFKIHHGLSDGYTFVHLVEKLTGVKSPYGFKENKLALFQKAKIWLNLPNIWLEYHVKQATSKDLLYPLSNKNPEWFISFVTIDLEQIKKVRQKFKTHFNCVIISAFVESLRRHFLESGRVPGVSDLPEITWVGSSIGLPDHPAMTMDNGAMTNHMTIGGFRVPLREKSPTKRLLALEQDFDLFHKRGVHKLVHWGLFKSIWALPAPMNRFANKKFDNFGFLRYTTYVSPLMLSSQPFELMGHKVHSLYLPALTPSLSKYTSMYVVPVSFSGKIDLSITASSEVVNNQEDLDRFSNILLKEALQEFSNL